MILQKVRLFPFGGTKERGVVFSPGLNVIAGPNEAGKSTMIGAIFAALFFSSALRKNSTEWKHYIAPFLPYPHGDTVQVALHFRCVKGETYMLERAWGESRKDRLVLPDGGEVNNPATIDKLLAPLLQYGRGTYEGILLAGQVEMLRTVELLRENREATGNLAEALRNLVFQSGGISVEILQHVLQQEKDALLKLWDLQRGVPQGGRSIDNPYKRGLGEIVSVYYEVEGLKRQLRNTAVLEERVQKLNVRLQEVVREKKENLEPRVKDMEKLETVMRRRAQLEPELALLNEKQKALRELNAKWPQLLERQKHLNAGVKERAKRRADLEQELAEAKEVSEARALRDLYQKVKPLKEAWEIKKKELSALPPVKQSHLAQMEQLAARHDKLQATLKAMKLQGQMSAIKPLQLRFTSGTGQEEPITVASDYAFEAEGRLRLQSSDWTLEIRSGQGDVTGIIREIEKTETILQQKLQEISVQTLEEARRVVERRAEKEKSLERLEAQLEALLKDTSYQELSAKVAASAAERSVRDPERIGEELKAAAVEEKTMTRELEEIDKQLQLWERDYGSYEKIVDRLVELRAESRSLENELAELPSLPAQWQSPNAFIEELHAVRAKNLELQETRHELIRALDQAKNELPEESVEELQEQLALGEKKLQNLQARARTLCVVEQEFKSILEELDASAFDPLAVSLLKYFEPMTDYRYNLVRLEGSLPQCIGRSGGRAKELPVNLLSVGTKRALALALRLAMAEYLWDRGKGFLIMDDPLVDLDPRRRHEAAKVLKDFAAGMQLIITTCDPDTAQLLGGACQTLEP